MGACVYYNVCGLSADDADAEGLCILHSRSQEKDADGFRSALEAHMQKVGHVFTLFHFPKLASFRGFTFRSIADFSNASFSSDADFAAAQFKESLFVGTLFGGEANFSEAQFANKTLFKDCKFEALARFNQASFGGAASFVTCIFGSAKLSLRDLVDLPSLATKLKQQPADAVSSYLITQFSGATLKALVSYPEPNPDPVPLQTALIEELNKVIEGQSIYAPARFAAVTLRPETRKLLSENLQGDTLFRLNKLLIQDAYPELERNRKEGVSFESTSFDGDCDFGGTVFKEATDFSGAIFAGRSSFMNARFKSEKTPHPEEESSESEHEPGVYFKETLFSKLADFSYADFALGAHFGSTHFLGHAEFRETAFRRAAWFIQTIFEGGASFSAAQSAPDVTYSFHRARFLGRTVFGVETTAGSGMQDQPALLFSGPAKVDLTDVEFSDKAGVVFRNADFSCTKLTHSDVRAVDFIGVLWPRLHDQSWPRWPDRNGTYDEILHFRKRPDKGLAYSTDIEALYRRLKKNYEDRHNYAMSGDFHYGEKEMRRHNRKLSLLHRFFLCFYRLLSGYGESYRRPFVWAVLLWGVTSVALFLGEFAVPTESLNQMPWRQVASFWECVLYSFRAMLFLRPTELELIDIWGTLIYTVQVTMGVLLLTLFAVAVRQRLRR